MPVNPATLQERRAQYADIESGFKAVSDRDFDALAESEARYIPKFRPIERLRDRIIEERDARLSGLGEEGTGKDQVALARAKCSG